ncbi:His/Gly/Thr/Pro-type tRNA ligase C-terminal domain-containing protein, partial [Salinispira pacifica]
DLHFQEEGGGVGYPFMGAYGIGIGRLMAAIVEANHDKKGILWPPEIAPYRIFLMSIGKSHRVRELTEMVSDELGDSVLYDDRRESISAKFKDADLLGIPYRVVVSTRSLEDGSVEVMERRTGRVFRVPVVRTRAHIEDLEQGRL